MAENVALSDLQHKRVTDLACRTSDENTNWLGHNWLDGSAENYF